MSIRPRGTRLTWLLGIALLIGTALGAHWLLNQPATGTTPQSPPEPQVMGIVAIGHADVEGGIGFLHPTQIGRVESVLVKEGDHVKEGDLLLSVDNQAAKSKLRIAEAGLSAAKAALQDAETLPMKWQKEIEQQQHRLEAAQYELKGPENDLRVLEDRSMDPGQSIKKETVDAAKAKVDSLKALIKANEAALEGLKISDPRPLVDRARAEVQAKQAQRDLAHQAVVECDLYAPTDGEVLRLFAAPGDVLSSQPRQAVVQFCPDAPRIIRAESLQEFAGKIQKGQVALVEDDTRSGVVQWKGKVERVGDWFSQRRSVLQEPFQFNDVRSLECIISVDAGGPPLRIGQRLRVTIKQGGP